MKYEFIAHTRYCTGLVPMYIDESESIVFQIYENTWTALFEEKKEKLKKLRLNEYSLLQIPLFENLQTCKELENLSISLADPKGQFITTENTKTNLSTIFSHLPKLRILSLTRLNDDFSNRKFISLLKNKNLANLEQLELKDYAFSGITFKKKIFKVIISNFQELKQLRLNCVITKQEVKYLSTNLPNLNILVITKKCCNSEEKAYEQILRELKSDLKIVTSATYPLPQSIIKWNKTLKNVERKAYFDNMSFYDDKNRYSTIEPPKDVPRFLLDF